MELDKENEYSVGRTLRVGKFSYSDLDELIVLHVKAMAKKVDEMCGDEKYQNLSKEALGKFPPRLIITLTFPQNNTNTHLTEAWLTTYTEANPRHGSYNFAIDPSHPGYFYLMFKANHKTPCVTWPAKVIPSGFELQGNKYPNMQALRNGFKTLCLNHGAGGVRRAPQTNGR